ncbi:MAG: transcription antitermination factor NusB [Clostridia bacterium]|nr:transcription antitermination factor NusB [Clostridia bacterium]
MSRRLSREEAFKVLFEISFQGKENIDSVLDYYYENLSVPQLEKSYFEVVTRGVCEKKGELDDYISRFSKGWTKQRISRVGTSLLRLSMYEILYMNDIPNGVSANEAVELAKKYESPECGAFINGILGTLIRSLGEKKENS